MEKNLLVRTDEKPGPSSHSSETNVIETFTIDISRRFVPSLPFKKGPRFPDVGVANATFRWFCDVLLLKELLDGLSHHRHGIGDVGRLILPVDELEGDQT